MTLRVARVSDEALGIKVYELVDPDGASLPAFTAGAHLDVVLGDHLVRQYSLCGDAGDASRYRIAVLREPESRGGSQAMHESIAAGGTITVSEPRNNFPLAAEAARHILLAGGIGVTPMIAMARSLASAGADFTLHYCTKSPEHTAFRDELAPLIESGRVICHHDGGDPSKGLDIAALLKNHEAGTHLYYCGPTGFMHAAEAASAAWPKDCVHFEYFINEVLEEAGDGDRGFEVEIASSGKRLRVPADKSIVQILWDNGIDIETSCESGLCGTCITRYKSGDVDHRDMVLDDDEKGEFLTVCCSRSKGKLLVLDL